MARVLTHRTADRATDTTLGADAAIECVATVEHGLALRRAGVGAPLLAARRSPGAGDVRAIRAAIDLPVSTPAELIAVAAAAGRAGGPARVHLSLDAGRVGDGGCTPERWPALVAVARRLDRAGRIDVVGVRAQFGAGGAAGGHAGRRPTAAEVDRFDRAVRRARQLGLRPRVCRLSGPPAVGRPGAVEAAA